MSLRVPPLLLAPPYQKVMVKTDGGNTITLDDTPGIGGITLEQTLTSRDQINAELRGVLESR